MVHSVEEPAVWTRGNEPGGHATDYVVDWMAGGGGSHCVWTSQLVICLSSTDPENRISMNKNLDQLQSPQ